MQIVQHVLQHCLSSTAAAAGPSATAKAVDIFAGLLASMHQLQSFNKQQEDVDYLPCACMHTVRDCCCLQLKVSNLSRPAAVADGGGTAGVLK